MSPCATCGVYIYMCIPGQASQARRSDHAFNTGVNYASWYGLMMETCGSDDDGGDDAGGDDSDGCEATLDGVHT